MNGPKAEMTEEIHDAHTKEIWSMCLYADKKGFVTASADQTVKFWSFEALKAEGWSVVHTRTLQLQEDALAVKLSPDGRLIAVSLMDSTIKVCVFESKTKSLRGVPLKAGPPRQARFGPCLDFGFQFDLIRNTQSKKN